MDFGIAVPMRPQYTNVRDRQDRQWSHSTGRKRFTNGPQKASKLANAASWSDVNWNKA